MERAKEDHKRALGIRLKKLGPKHATVKRSRLELDNVQPSSDDPQNGREHQEPNLIIFEDLASDETNGLGEQSLYKVSFVFKFQVTIFLFLSPLCILFVFTRGARDFTN